MKPRSRSLRQAVQRFRAAWPGRPRRTPRALWAIIVALDRLPWPWGEDILARLFVAKALFRPLRFRRALAWASVSLGGRCGQWHLALSLHANQGRFVARKTLVGIRHPDDLRRHLVVQGQEHLDTISGGRIFLAFHLGLGGLDGLRALGHRVTALWVPSTLWAWPEKAWRSLDAGGELASLRGDRAAWGSALYQACLLYTSDAADE